MPENFENEPYNYLYVMGEESLRRESRATRLYQFVGGVGMATSVVLAINAIPNIIEAAGEGENIRAVASTVVYAPILSGMFYISNKILNQAGKKLRAIRGAKHEALNPPEEV